MTSYRRGFKGQVWDRHWHWHVRCESYPTINCIIQKEKPADDELCQRCNELPQLKKVPKVFVSGSREPDELLERTGAIAFLAKPIHDHQILELLVRLQIQPAVVS